MNDDEKELLKVGAETAMKPFADLITKLFGGPIEQVGGMWTDSLMVRREIRKIKLYQKLKTAIDEAAFDPRTISDKIWLPAVHEALLEEDETIQQLWANLLANAADPRQQNHALPAFPNILKELTTREARFLDALLNQASKPPRIPGHEVPPVTVEFSKQELFNVFTGAGLTIAPENALPLSDRRSGVLRVSERHHYRR
jgi:hypothetical protein